MGSKDVLSKNNIQLVDLPGVGEHYIGSFKMLQRHDKIHMFLKSTRS